MNKLMLLFEEPKKLAVKEIRAKSERLQKHETTTEERQALNELVLKAIPNSYTDTQTHYNNGYDPMSGMTYSEYAHYEYKDEYYALTRRFLGKKMFRITFHHTYDALKIIFHLKDLDYFVKAREIAEKLQTLVVERFILTDIKYENIRYHNYLNALDKTGLLYTNSEWYDKNKPELYGKIRDFTLFLTNKTKEEKD